MKIKSQIIKKFAPVALFALMVMPWLVGAQTPDPTFNLITRIGFWVKALIPIVIGLALLAFFYGLVKFLFSNASADAKDDGKRIMIWGVVAMFVMVSIWGLVNFIQGTTGVTDGSVNNVIVPTSVPRR